ncbi:hypothetical protein SAMN03159443_04820 [Pseudomonas sp. NFACC15-1]|jgi:hypothetical protein|uniref:Uncharacterized protein n=2 Tax=Pseudomonas TaxID=286 RepID=A0A0N9WYT1_PSEFL|nr:MULTISPECIES: hypothetical protein [Pseudomonas]ALI09153.1 hypothetical protein AO356_20795 [Pseudomonas fluorescens]POA11236.1 hypothetical protein C1892_27360 [Pseudomonas sp. MPBD7-1]WLG99491.1 hypothetical protein PSH92_19240 [Pseudomonas sp. FP2034]WLH44621.1 hypothetical protein PSH83_19905 [Pseudomonas sp. FP2262]WLI46298.1 hypothetical protein PSH84_05130 [Pseudomonas sp. FP830]
MTADSPVPNDEETPEYPLPSPTNPLSRDQLPPDDEAGVEQVPSDDEDVEATPDDPDIAGDDASGTPS